MSDEISSLDGIYCTHEYRQAGLGIYHRKHEGTVKNDTDLIYQSAAALHINFSSGCSLGAFGVNVDVCLVDDIADV